MHPILHICRAIPEVETDLTGEFIDKMHLIFSGTNIYHSKNRDECFEIITKILPELGILDWYMNSSKIIKISPGKITKEIIEYYGKEDKRI